MSGRTYIENAEKVAKVVPRPPGAYNKEVNVNIQGEGDLINTTAKAAPWHQPGRKIGGNVMEKERQTAQALN